MATERFADFGQGDDPPSTVGGPGSINSHLRLMTTQLAGLSSPTVNVPNPLGVSGTVSLTMESIEIGKVDQGTGNAGGSPWAISGSVTVLNASSNNQGTGNAGSSPWSVSGSVSLLGTSNVSVTNQPTFNQGVGNAGTSPWVVSGTVSIGNTPTINQGTSPWVVSGGVDIGAPLPTGSNTIGNVGLNASTNTIGTVAQGVGNAASSPWSVSGTITANPGVGVFTSTINKVSGTISVVNSTTTPLASGAVFTGTAEDVSSYATISINSYSDVASASGGFSFQFSEDGVNWDAKAAYTTSASGFFSVTMPPRPQFFRVVYTNGVTTQTVFRLQTIYHPVALFTSTAVPMQDNDPNPSAPRGSSHLMTFNSSEGVWTRARDAMTASGSTGRGVLGVGPQVYDNTNNAWRALLGDTAGRLVVAGPTASGTVFVSNPLLIAGADVSGTIRTLLTDNFGVLKIQGSQGAGTAVGIPIVVAGQNAGNVKYLALNAAGGVNQGDGNTGGQVSWSVQGSAGSGTTVIGNPVTIAGSDTGGNVRTLLTTNIGAAIVAGNAPSGSAPLDNPLLIAGASSDNNKRTIHTDTLGNQIIVGPTPSGQACGCNPELIAGSDAGNILRTILTDGSGRLEIVGGTTSGSTGVGINPVVIGVTDLLNNVQQMRAPQATSASQVGPNSFPGVVVLMNGNGDFRVPASFGSAGDAINAFGVTSAGMVGYNGTGIGTGADRWRNNISTIIQASTATATGTTNLTIVTYNLTRFLLHANVTVYNGGNVTFTLQYKDANGLFTNIPGATTGPISSGADILLTVGGCPWPANTTNTFYSSAPITRTLQLQTVVAGATVTFSSAYELFLG